MEIEETIGGRLSSEDVERLLKLAKKVERGSADGRYNRRHPFSRAPEISESRKNLRNLLEEKEKQS